MKSFLKEHQDSLSKPEKKPVNNEPEEEPDVTLPEVNHPQKPSTQESEDRLYESCHVDRLVFCPELKPPYTMEKLFVTETCLTANFDELSESCRSLIESFYLDRIYQFWYDQNHVLLIAGLLCLIVSVLCCCCCCCRKCCKKTRSRRRRKSRRSKKSKKKHSEQVEDLELGPPPIPVIHMNPQTIPGLSSYNPY